MRAFWTKITLVSALVLITNISIGQSVTGQWKTIDDETGKARSIVDIYKKGDKLYGKIIKLFREPHEIQDPICKVCDDDRKGQKVLGMEIIRDMELDGNEWEDGTILDPKSGKIYDCKIWINEEDPNKLNVRGYVAFFYRTQTWLRVK